MARGVGNHTFLDSVGIGIIDKGDDHPICNTADPDTTSKARIIARRRRGVGDVKHVITIDIHTAGAAELSPLCEKNAILIEDLYPVITAITDKQPPARIPSQGVRGFEFTGIMVTCLAVQMLTGHGRR